MAYDNYEDDLDYLVFALNLFNGQVHFNEIYNMPLDLLSDLIDAKFRLKQEEERQMQKLMDKRKER